MKISTSLILSAFMAGACVISAHAQTYVSTLPENKNVVIEEFTGVRCGPCVAGNTTLKGILDANPGRIFGVGMSPNNSGLTAPYGSDEDLRRAYLDAFYTEPYYGTIGRSMPSAHVNRRIYGGNRKLSSSAWSGNATAFLSEPSPVNLGISSTYDSGADELTVTVEVYYTQGVTDPNTINCVLIEDGIVTEHASYGVGYVNDHMFREELHTGQWGETVSPTTQGSLVTFNWTYDNSSTNYDISKSHVVAYISNSTIEEVYTAQQVEADGGFTVNINNKPVAADLGLAIYPNPMNNEAFVHYSVSENAPVTVSITNMLGQTVYSENLGMLNRGKQVYNINKAQMGLGEQLYFVSIAVGNNVQTKKLSVN